MKRNFNAVNINEKWSTDITYIIYNGKRVYLSSIMDLCSRDIIAYKISNRLDNKLVMDTLNEAIKKKMYTEPSCILIKDSNIHPMNIKLSANQME